MKLSETSKKYLEKAETYGAHNYKPLDVVLTRGEGPFVWDVDGKRYFDFLSAYSAVGQGHCHPRIVAAMVDQAKRLALSSRAFQNDKYPDFVERVAKLTTFDQVLPMNSGAEGVETALKAMRRWGYKVKGVPDGKAEIIVVSGNFHGRTVTIVSFSDEPLYMSGFGPPTPGFKLVEWDDAKAIEAAIGPNTVGVLLEPIQGEAGVRIPSPGYLKKVREVCTKHKVLLAFDEVQTGLGRTGKMFAWQHEDAKPDVIILGKALSGGMYPVSAMCANKEVMGVFTHGSHGSTFGGNPIAAAVGLASIDVLVDERLVEKSAELGAYALKRLQAEVKSKDVLEVRGKGLMMAVEFKTRQAHDIAHDLMEVGVLAKDTRATTIRLMPPLVITRAQLDEALTAMMPVLNQA